MKEECLWSQEGWLCMIEVNGDVTLGSDAKGD